jgi:two-component system cell cycle sensor histidine kinase/response regulator CckA
MSEEKHRRLASLRRELRELAAELGAVVHEETRAPSDPRTLAAREQVLTEAERIAKVGSWVWHVTSGNVHWSDEMYRIFGVDPAERTDLMERFFSRVHPEDIERVKEAQARLMEAGTIDQVEHRLLLPGGAERTVRTAGAAVLDDTGAIVRFVGTVLDLTAIRAAEGERARNEEMHRAGEALAGVGTFRWGTITGELTWSAQLREIAGLPAGHPPSLEFFMERLHPEDRPVFQASVAAALSVGKTKSLRARLLRDDGEVRDVQLEGTFLPDGVMLGAVLDVTAVRKLEAALFQAQKLEALGRLAGGIAHDFNNILAVLRLGLDARGAAASPLAAELGVAIDRGTSLTRQLLAFGRKHMLEPRAVDAGELLRQSASMVARLLGDAVEARVELGDETLSVFVDPGQLQHTLINLMLNARDAMPSGGTIGLRARACSFDRSPPDVQPALQPGEYVEVEVADEGTGIPDAVMPHLFEPFFTTKPSGQGTGLGLASAFGTVSQSGGGLGVRSIAGEGSKFHLYLPRATEPATRVSEPPAAARGGGGEKVLVLDDRVSLRRALSTILRDAGFEVVEVEDVAALVRDAQRVAQSCAAMITDVDMPGYSGPDVARALWSHAPHLPVLFMSGHLSVALPTDVPARTEWLPKPFPTERLLERLAVLLGRGEPATRPETGSHASEAEPA